MERDGRSEVRGQEGRLLQAVRVAITPEEDKRSLIALDVFALFTKVLRACICPAGSTVVFQTLFVSRVAWDPSTSAAPHSVRRAPLLAHCRQ